MAEVISCPDCQRKLQLPDELMGQEVRCPSCGREFVAEIGGSAPPPVPRYEELPARPREDRSERPPPSDWEEDYEDYERHRLRRRRDLMPHRGGTILAVGIISFFVCMPILGPTAWIMGSNDLKEIRAGRMDPDGEGTTNAGRICGIISTCLFGAMVLFYCIIGILAGIADGGRGF